MTDDHEIRLLQRRLKIANKTMGKQGRTIHELRAELALTREEHNKIDRGELRRLENFEAMALVQFAEDRDRLRAAIEEVKRLRDKLDDKEPTP
jgi:hypothetical protein